MRVLLVDCFTQSKRGRENFSDFKYTIEKALEGPYYKYLTEVALGVRHYRNLGDFIYDIDGTGNGEYNDSNSLKAFQNLDVVFISGDEPGLVPWSEQARPIRMLMKQCCSYSMPTFVLSTCRVYSMFLILCVSIFCHTES